MTVETILLDPLWADIMAIGCIVPLISHMANAPSSPEAATTWDWFGCEHKWWRVTWSGERRVALAVCLSDRKSHNFKWPCIFAVITSAALTNATA